VQPIDTLTSKAFQAVKGLCDAYDIKIGLLQVRENEISLRTWSAGTAHLRSCAVAHLRRNSGLSAFHLHLQHAF